MNPPGIALRLRFFSRVDLARRIRPGGNKMNFPENITVLCVGRNLSGLSQTNPDRLKPVLPVVYFQGGHSVCSGLIICIRGWILLFRFPLRRTCRPHGLRWKQRGRSRSSFPVSRHWCGTLRRQENSSGGHTFGIAGSSRGSPSTHLQPPQFCKSSWFSFLLRSGIFNRQIRFPRRPARNSPGMVRRRIFMRSFPPFIRPDPPPGRKRQRP